MNNKPFLASICRRRTSVLVPFFSFSLFSPFFGREEISRGSPRLPQATVSVIVREGEHGDAAEDVQATTAEAWRRGWTFAVAAQTARITPHSSLFTWLSAKSPAAGGTSPGCARRRRRLRRITSLGRRGAHPKYRATRRDPSCSTNLSREKS